MSVLCTQCLQQIGQVSSARTRGLSAGRLTWAERSLARVLARNKKNRAYEMFSAEADEYASLWVEVYALKVEKARLLAAKKAWDRSVLGVLQKLVVIF